MKTHKYISALLVVASALLSSCSLLVSSPIGPSGPHHHFAGYGPRPHRSGRVYNSLLQVPADGGIYEFDCANDEFYISRIFDSSMPEPQRYSHADCRYSPTANDYISVNDVTYSGPFYTITCNRDKHNWIIEIDPLIATSGELDYREIRVFMWDGSDNSNFVFQFEQSDSDSFEYIE